MKVRAADVKVGQYVRLDGDGHIEQIGDVWASTSALVHLIIGHGGRGFYEFANDDMVEVGVERKESMLTFDTQPLDVLGQYTPEEYIESSVRIHGEHVRDRFAILTRTVLVFESEWVQA